MDDEVEEKLSTWLTSIPDSEISFYDVQARQCHSSNGKPSKLLRLVVCLIGAAQDELAETAALERKNKGIPDPPMELERALLLLEGGERPLRGDAIDLFINNPLPRFLLLACGK